MSKTLIQLASFLIVLSYLFPLVTPSTAQTPTAVDLYSIGKKRFQEAPKLLISQPEEGATIFGNQVTVQIVVDNLILTNPQKAKKNRKGQGHLHLWLDEPTPSEKPIEHFRVTEYVFTDIAAGEHTLTVEVVQNDHSSFEPPIKKTVHFTTIPKPSPTLETAAGKKASLFDTILPRRIPMEITLIIALSFILTGLLLWYWNK